MFTLILTVIIDDRNVATTSIPGFATRQLAEKAASDHEAALKKLAAGAKLVASVAEPWSAESSE